MTRCVSVLFALSLTIMLVACSGPDNGSDPTPTSPIPTVTSPAAITPTVTTPIVAPTSTEPPTATAIPTIVPTVAATTPPTATTQPTNTPTNTPEPTVTPTPTPLPPTPTSTQTSGQGFITIRTADTTDPIVALTFDAGADRGYAEDILDTLQSEGIHATFGMTAIWAEANPDLVLRMVNEGHILVNHTNTHRSWTGYSTGEPPLSSAERAEELHTTEDVVETISGYDMRPYFRPPYGDYDDSVIADLQANGYTVNVMWTVDSLGWNGLSATDITARVINGAVPGAIYLFHVGAASQDAAALPDIIAGLRGLGYRFVTVADMVGR